MNKPLTSTLLAVTTLIGGQAWADQNTSVDIRLRHESVTQEGTPDLDATANTVRYRVGYSFPDGAYSLYVESEGTLSVGDEDYNSGPGGNGHTQYAVIADPTGHELNQLYVDWRSESGQLLRIGRQRLIYDNARFVGNVGWRQNEQTFDAARLTFILSDKVNGQYAYIQNAHGIFFNDSELDGHLLNSHWAYSQAHSLRGYAYLLDFDSGEDSRTLGLSLQGTWAWNEQTSLKYHAEFARQSDYADSPSLIEADYHLLSLSLNGAQWSFALNQETLGGDGTRGFSTPLATKHKFNGYADQFLATPTTGLQDRHAQITYKQGTLKLIAIWHQFSSDQGDTDFGKELDLVGIYKFSEQLKGILKAARYEADSHKQDIDKISLQFDYSL